MRRYQAFGVVLGSDAMPEMIEHHYPRRRTGLCRSIQYPDTEILAFARARVRQPRSSSGNGPGRYHRHHDQGKTANAGGSRQRKQRCGHKHVNASHHGEGANRPEPRNEDEPRRQCAENGAQRARRKHGTQGLSATLRRAGHRHMRQDRGRDAGKKGWQEKHEACQHDNGCDRMINARNDWSREGAQGQHREGGGDGCTCHAPRSQPHG